MHLKYLCASTGRAQARNRCLNGCGEPRQRRPTSDRAGFDAGAMVQFGWPIGMPLVRSLKDGLWEVRSTLPSHRVARLILCFRENKLVVLHGFIKKTRTTPAEDLTLAKRRMKEVMT